MKSVILIIAITLLSCVKVEDELVVTNTTPKRVEVRINGQKSWTMLDPDESVSFFVSGMVSVKLLSFNTVIIEDSILVDGLTYYP